MAEEWDSASRDHYQQQTYQDHLTFALDRNSNRGNTTTGRGWRGQGFRGRRAAQLAAGNQVSQGNSQSKESLFNASDYKYQEIGRGHLQGRSRWNSENSFQEKVRDGGYQGRQANRGSRDEQCQERNYSRNTSNEEREHQSESTTTEKRFEESSGNWNKEKHATSWTSGRAEQGNGWGESGHQNVGSSVKAEETGGWDEGSWVFGNSQEETNSLTETGHEVKTDSRNGVRHQPKRDSWTEAKQQVKGDNWTVVRQQVKEDSWNETRHQDKENFVTEASRQVKGDNWLEHKVKDDIWPEIKCQETRDGWNGARDQEKGNGWTKSRHQEKGNNSTEARLQGKTDEVRYQQKRDNWEETRHQEEGNRTEVRHQDKTDSWKEARYQQKGDNWDEASYQGKTVDWNGSRHQEKVNTQAKPQDQGNNLNEARLQKKGESLNGVKCKARSNISNKEQDPELSNNNEWSNDNRMKPVQQTKSGDSSETKFSGNHEDNRVVRYQPNRYSGGAKEKGEGRNTGNNNRGSYHRQNDFNSVTKYQGKQQNSSEGNIKNRGGGQGKGQTRGGYSSRGDRHNQRDNERRNNSSSDQHSPDKEKRVVKPMGYYKLKDLMSKEPDEVMLYLKAESGGFKELLNKMELESDKVAMVIQLLARAAQSDQIRNLLSFMAMVNKCSVFMYVTLQKYLISFSISKTHCKPEYIDSLIYLLEYLQAFSVQQPANACETVKLLLPQIKSAAEHLFTQGYDLNFCVIEMMENLEQMNSKNINKYADKDHKKIVEEEKQHSQEPPDSFRLISIFPTQDDLMNETPFLRCNIVDGKYMDVEHYLDVQFRLLREDSVRSLREGIMEYRSSINSKHIKGLRVYTGVRVLYPKCSVNGVVHAISFEMRPHLKYVRWETSKRLLEGSLVCLSKDKFQTMIFATVTKRDLQYLTSGVLFVRFEKYDDVKSILPTDEFVLVETSAFFEAYRHVLSALQDLHEQNFPFKRYLVELNSKVNPPCYMSEYTTFDLRPLMAEFPKIRVCDGGPDLSEMVYSPLVENGQKVVMLDHKTWPPPYEMSMDTSQQEALRSALTKEVAIIQGPPGTGKTFIGLRIVQALLHNMQVWGKGNDMSSILIVCFTNHALDQFLEGVLYFTSSLVRVGTRSESEILKPFNLTELRHDYRQRRAFPQALNMNRRENVKRLQDFEKQIHTLDAEINVACTDVVTEIDLHPYMSKPHLRSLRGGDGDMPGFTELHNDQKLILDWLGLRFRGKHAQNWFREQTQQMDFTKVESENSAQASQSNALEGDPDYEASLEFQDNEADETFLQSFYNDPAEEQPEPEYDDDESDSEERPRYDPDEYWEMNGGATARKNYLTRQLKQRHMMNEDDANKIKQIWMLPLHKRWDLYRLWTAKYIMGHFTKISELQSNYQKELSELAELRHGCDLHILKGARIIGMTTTGASKHKKLVQGLKPSILIVEEAAEVLEAHIVTCMIKETKHVIMIGDHQQLRPIPSVYMLAKKYNLDVSLFERLVNNGLPCAQLNIQHRMRPCISKLLVPHIYKVLKDHESTNKYDSVKGVSQNMYFLTHDFFEANERDTTTKINTHEAEFLVKLAKYFCHQGYKKEQVTILATYSGQLLLLRKLMATDPSLEGVKATSVDNYQGEENDIVLISFVRSNADHGIGFLKTENRVCVALSRARKGLFCIGNFRFLAENSELWQNIIQELGVQNAIGPELELYCQNHPNTTCPVRRASDFESVPEGGCTRPCQIRLPCGHKCPRMCHPYDNDHKLYQCSVICNKITCQEQHRCRKKCFQCIEDGCGPCGYPVYKELDCGHDMKIPCYQDPKNAICRSECMKMMACGHLCQKKCGENCTAKCLEKVHVLSPCGHQLKVACYQMSNEEIILSMCRVPCRKDLFCGHQCRGTCSSCHQGRLHEKCKEKCSKPLVCGHTCKEPCSNDCPACKQSCENHCKHSKCSKVCGIPCEPCRQPCDWKCPHHLCTNLCGEICNRPICTEPCPKKRPCKHPCVGICGELCPKLCRICKKKQLTDVFFGDEDSDDARFLMLEDCEHVFEVTGFFKWLKTEIDKSIVKVPRCPKCQTAIRDSNQCLGNIVKTILESVNKVKEKSFGIMRENTRRHRDLKVLARNYETTIETHFKPLLQHVQANLSLERLEESRLTGMENYLKMLKQLDDSFQEMFPAVTIDSSKKLHLKSLSITVGRNPLEELIEGLLRKLLEFMTRNCRNPGIQQIKDVDREVLRFQLVARLLKARYYADQKVPLSVTDNQKVHQCFHDLFAPKTLESGVIRKVQEAIAFLNATRGIANLGVSEIEKRAIVEAVGLKQGHWFKCPKGHVYCIGECGGAMEIARCGECGEKIGGVDHNLQPGNQLAEEMDGASYAAYSEAANLAYIAATEGHGEVEDWFEREQ